MGRLIRDGSFQHRFAGSSKALSKARAVTRFITRAEIIHIILNLELSILVDR